MARKSWRIVVGIRPEPQEMRPGQHQVWIKFKTTLFQDRPIITVIFVGLQVTPPGRSWERYIALPPGQQTGKNQVIKSPPDSHATDTQFFSQGVFGGQSLPLNHPPALDLYGKISYQLIVDRDNTFRHKFEQLI